LTGFTWLNIEISGGGGGGLVEHGNEPSVSITGGVFLD
jgi:hypothetical protein